MVRPGVGPVLGMAGCIAVFSTGVRAAELFAPNWFADTVNRYDTATGSLISTYSGGGLDGPQGVAVDGNGVLHVVGNLSRTLVPFDVASGAVSGSATSFTSPFNAGSDMEIGPDGNLYTIVTSPLSAFGFVERFDAQTGASLGGFTTSVLSPGGITFGPDGNLYMTSAANDEILRFDGQTGGLLGTFASTGMVQPEGLAFGPDGDLYVADAAADAVLRYDGTTGAFVNVVDSGPQLDFVWDVAFDPDGLLYASTTVSDTIRRYDPVDDSFVDVFATGIKSFYMEIVPEPSTLLLCAVCGGLMVSRRRRTNRA